ncbi:MAG: Serine/threonine-protein kinase Pkn1 [Chlamydiae bacterium]|nr:Serine/threonine-protein kinase Pkn1 [Chlamydiota bacterium]
MENGEEKFYKQNTLPSALMAEGALPPLPDSVGPYKIETLLSRGGTSILYLGVEAETREMRAIKVLSPEFLDHPEMVDHFLWEAKIIGLANHPNIVKLYDYGAWEGGLFIAVEFIRGVSLRQFLAGQAFSLRKAISIILQVSYALCHLHAHGVIHRDLKPENILIAEDGEVKVIDFGIAQLHENEEQKGLGLKMMGTPSYMSPEQKENPQNVSFASDIYALGIITYELILGKLSYGMINPTLLPSGLQKIVEKALAISLKERYDDIVDFITDLTEYYKSPAIEKDRPGGDQVIEFTEVIQRVEKSLSAATLPNWTQLELGMAKHFLPMQMGLYYDFYKCANNTLITICAQTESMGVKSAMHISALKGMVTSLIHPYLHDSTKALNLSEFATTLNELVLGNMLNDQFRLSMVKLIPQTDTLLYLGCGMGPMLHLPQGSSQPHRLISNNPPIGVDLANVFLETGDNWAEGDLLILHSHSPEGMGEGEPLGDALLNTLNENALLSATRLSERLLEKSVQMQGEHESNYPSILFSYLRIG